MSSGSLHESPETATPPPPRPVRLSRGPRALLAAAAAAIALVTVVQLAAIFLDSAPPNTVSERYHPQITWWIRPLFEQNWKLFAPDPQSANTTIDVRVRDPRGDVSRWVDLTAIDYAAVLHDPMPSHANENELRLAWNAYADAKDGSGTQRLLRQYLVNIALERLTSSTRGPYAAVQFKVTNNPMPRPGSKLPSSPDTQNTAWWILGDGNPEATGV